MIAFLSAKCLACGGRGWIWVGVGGNADREPCDLCTAGRRQVDWYPWLGVLALLVSAATVIGTAVYLIKLFA